MMHNYLIFLGVPEENIELSVVHVPQDARDYSEYKVIWRDKVSLPTRLMNARGHLGEIAIRELRSGVRMVRSLLVRLIAGVDLYEVQANTREIMYINDMQREEEREEEREREMALRAELEEKNKQLEAMARIDKRTGILNLEGGEQFLSDIWSILARNKDDKLCMLMIDIDYFKKFNDTYGHEVGNITLRTVAQTIQSCIRDSDRVFRYGGEEFVVVLTNTGLPEAKIAAEKIRLAVEKQTIPLNDERNIGCTISLGVTSLKPHDYREEPKEVIIKEVIAVSDAAMYKAKGKEGDPFGRNRCSSIVFSRAEAQAYLANRR
jgi:diguanylate cyclase (GGDEF)-like protein